MKPSDFDYSLPEELIARYPLADRSGSKLLVLRKDTGALEHKKFADITKELKPGDLLLLNDTRVIPARVIGKKESGGRVEILAIQKIDNTSKERELWQCMVKSSKGLKPGGKIFFDNGLWAEAIRKDEQGIWTLAFSGGAEGAAQVNLVDALWEQGEVPLPPYLGREAEPLDKDRYQTVFAKREGAVAAPTAGLHFTEEIISELKTSGVQVEYVTLHTGLATFMPIRGDDAFDHTVPEERYEVSERAAKAIERTKREGGRVVAVGTTVTRTVETVFKDGFSGSALKGGTSLFIYPGFEFKVVDALLTNFHLPCSTLIMLVSAFAGKENVMKAYKEAIDLKYRFFSYGDCMLVV